MSFHETFMKIPYNCSMRSEEISRINAAEYTPPIPEIIWVKNVRAIVVCGFLMKKFKKYVLKI